MTALEALQLLGLDKSASDEEIRVAFRDLIAIWHPDRHSGHERRRRKAEEKVKQLNAAYGLLRDGSWRHVGGHSQSDAGTDAERGYVQQDTDVSSHRSPPAEDAPAEAQNPHRRPKGRVPVLPVLSLLVLVALALPYLNGRSRGNPESQRQSTEVGSLGFPRNQSILDEPTDIQLQYEQAASDETDHSKDVFSKVASGGPQYLEIGYQRQYVRRLLGHPATITKLGTADLYPALEGYSEEVYRFRDGDVVVLFGGNSEARCVAVHSSGTRKFDEYNKGGHPTFRLNGPIRMVVEKVYGFSDIPSLPHLAQSYDSLYDGQVIAGVFVHLSSILYVQYWGGPSNYCTFIIRQDPTTARIAGFGYCEDLTTDEILWAVEAVFVPPDR